MSEFDAPTSTVPPIEQRPKSPKKKRIWTLFAATFAYAFFIFASVFLLIIGIFITRPELIKLESQLVAEQIQSILTEPNTFALVVFLTAFSGVFTALLVGALSPQKMSLRLNVGKPTAPIPVWAWLGGTLLVGALSEQIVFHLFAPLVGPSESLQTIGKSIEAAPSGSLFLLLLVIGVAAPVGEELLFRGVFQTRLVERWGPVVGILSASVLFSLVHMDIQHSLMVFPIGLCLGWMTYRTGSIRAAIATHIGNNIIATLTERSLPSWVNLTVFGVLTVFGLFCVAYLYRKKALPGQVDA